MQNNSSTNENQQDVILGASTQITLYAVLLAVSFVGNVLVIAVVYWNRDMRTNFNYLIVNMAVSDLLIPFIAIPIRISNLLLGYFSVGGQLGNILCKISYYLSDIPPVVSVVSLVLIAVNRYFAVCYPVRQQLSGRVVNRILLAVTWIVPMCLFSPYLIAFSTVEQADGLVMCENHWNNSIPGKNSFPIFIAIVVAISFVIPSICIVILYSLIIYKIHEHSRNMTLMLHHRQLAPRKRKNKHITYISLLIVIAFIVLWGPSYVFLCLVHILWQWNIPPDIRTKAQFIIFVITYLAFLNSAINPCIYFFCLKNYRQGLKCLLLRTKVRKTSQSFESASANRLGSLSRRSTNSKDNNHRTSRQMITAL